MTRALVIARKKEQYAPIVDAVQRTGLPILDFTDDLTGFDQLIVFHNKYFEPLMTPAKDGWWMSDYREPHELVANPKRNCHHIFLPHHNYHEAYRAHFGVPVSYVPQCGVEWPLAAGRNLNTDALFIGNVSNTGPYHHNREQILKEVSRLCHLEHLSGERTTADMRYLYSTAPISINITPPGMRGTSNRLYNILSSGGLCLTTYWEGMETEFENWKHLVWFKEPTDLFHIVGKLLSDARLAAHIRTNGRLLYETRHTAAHRLNQMTTILTMNHP